VLCCVLTTIGLLGFFYAVEFCQAVFLIAFPLSVVWLLTLRVAGQIRARDIHGEGLCRRLAVHRVAVQVIGMVAIVITAMWGMLQNFTVSPLG